MLKISHYNITIFRPFDTNSNYQIHVIRCKWFELSTEWSYKLSLENLKCRGCRGTKWQIWGEMIRYERISSVEWEVRLTLTIRRFASLSGMQFSSDENLAVLKGFSFVDHPMVVAVIKDGQNNYPSDPLGGCGIAAIIQQSLAQKF